MSDDTSQVHPALDNSEQQAAVDADTAQLQADSEAAQQKQEAEVKAAAATQEQDKFAQKFAALSRKEKALKQRERETEQRLQEMQSKLEQMEQEYRSKFIDPDTLTKDPLRVLSDRGLTPEQLAEMILNDGKRTPEHLVTEAEKRVLAKVQEIEEKLKQKELDEQKKRVDQVTSAFKNEISQFIETNAEYELIQANNAADLVYDTIEEYYNATLDENGENGTILSNKEACDLVEEYLLEEAKRVWEKANKKLQPLVGAKKEPVQEQKGQSPTLSNAMSASASNAGKKLTDEESKAEAAKLIRWID